MRAQLKHVLLDVDFLNNPKIRTLKSKFGQLSQLCLIDIYSAMSRATNAVLDEDCIVSIISEYKLSEEFLAYCLNKKLIESEMNGYSNSVVIKDQEQYYRKLNSGKGKNNSGKGKNNSEQKCSEKEQESASSDIDSDFDNDIDNRSIKNSAPEIPKSEFSEIAKKSLLAPDDPTIQKNSEFITMGRRPMRNYPEIRLTEHELCDVLEQYKLSGVPMDDRKIFMSAFKKVQSKIKTKAAQGQTTAFTNAYVWLTGFAKEDLLKELKASLDLKRSEIYTEKASA